MITKAISCNFCSSTYPTGGCSVKDFDTFVNDFYRHTLVLGWKHESGQIDYCPSCALLPEEQLYESDVEESVPLPVLLGSC